MITSFVVAAVKFMMYQLGFSNHVYQRHLQLSIDRNLQSSCDWQWINITINIYLTLDQHCTDTKLTLDQQLVDSQLNVNRLLCINWQFYNNCPISRVLIGWFLSSIRGQTDKIWKLGLVCAALCIWATCMRQTYLSKLYLFLVFDQFRGLLM